MTTAILAISGISIKQDSHGRFCLNDLHKAAGSENRHRPKYWTAIQQTQDLISLLKSEDCNYEGGIPPSKISPLETVTGKGKQQGTYVVKELVYAYAMWISAKFHIAVIRAYDSLVSKPAYGLIDLAPITKTQHGILGAIISEIATSSGKEGATKVGLWSRFSTHFKIGSSKDLPAIKFDEAKSYLENLKTEYDRGFTLAVVKKEDLLSLGYDVETKMFAVRALQQEQRKTSTWSNYATMTLALPNDNNRMLVSMCNGITTLFEIPESYMIGDVESLTRQLKLEGYHVVKNNPQDKLETIVKIAGFVA